MIFSIHSETHTWQTVRNKSGYNVPSPFMLAEFPEKAAVCRRAFLTEDEEKDSAH
jgi:hypothetical protein